MKKYLILAILFIVIASPLLIAFLIRGKTVSVDKVTLNLWGVEDKASDYQDLIKAYQGLHPYVKINYTQERLETYKDNLIKGWAKNTGPDIYALPSSWLYEFTDYILPMPQSTKVTFYQEKKILCRKQTEIKNITQKSITPQELKSQFVDTVYSDVVKKDKKGVMQIYGLPLSIDTLVLYYNKTLLNNAQIIEPAKSWPEIIQQVPKLTKLDSENNILQSGLALGLSDNVNHYFDILSLLMIQNGTSMTDPSGASISFDKSVSPAYNPGERALEFYTDFANLSKEVYSWNENQPSSLDAFTQGKVAYYIGYQKDKLTIDTNSPTLNYAIAPIPHINSDGVDSSIDSSGNYVQRNYATYWVFTAAQKTKYPNEVWNFIQFITQENRVKTYLEKTKKVSVLRTILASQIKDLDLGVFAGQALTATTWYHGQCFSGTENFFKSMINKVVKKEETILNSLTLAAKQTQETLKNTCQ